MTKVIVIDVAAKAIDGAERYLPEPAMGNQKAGTAEYEAKWKEKRNKQLQDLQEHSFLSEVLSLSYAVLSTDGVVFEVTTPVTTVSYVKDFLKATEGQIYEFISGIHPTTHARIIQTTAIRHGMQIPFWLTKRPRVNPWQLVGTQAEGEYPLPWVALGKKTRGPVQDTIDLLHAFGPAVLHSEA